MCIFNMHVTVLGERYKLAATSGKSESSSKGEKARFEADILSRFWFSYRVGFTAIAHTGTSGGYVSDAGWGCMLRCAQMLLAHQLMVLTAGRTWRWNQGGVSCVNDVLYRRIVEMFYDDPRAPFSIHRLARLGECLDKQVGQWFGPNTVSHVLRRALGDTGNMESNQSSNNEKLPAIDLRVLGNGLIGEDSLAWNPSNNHDDDDGRGGVLVMLCLRMGVTNINPIYTNCLHALMISPFFGGMLGGRPNAAFYFLGVEGDASSSLADGKSDSNSNHNNDASSPIVYYLDPHIIQPATNFDQHAGNAHADKTFHTTDYRTMRMSDMDPSVALSFLCRSKHELAMLKTDLHRIQTVYGQNCPFAFGGDEYSMGAGTSSNNRGGSGDGGDGKSGVQTVGSALTVGSGDECESDYELL